MFPQNPKAWADLAQFLGQRMALFIVVASAVTATFATLAAAMGLLPWIALQASFAGEPIPVGMPVQLTITIFLLGLTAFLPSARRVMTLELAHRQFRVSMEDVAQAYYAAHAADRQGVFRLKSEYDATRERLDFLHKHPDLMNLKPELLELAAKMSFNARELAQIYSEDRVSEAKSFLADRQSECVRLETEIEHGFAAAGELRALLDQVDDHEHRVAARISVLKAEMLAIMPRLGMEGSPYSGRPQVAAE